MKSNLCEKTLGGKCLECLFKIESEKQAICNHRNSPENNKINPDKEKIPIWCPIAKKENENARTT